jgi:hypothetical protein
MDTFPGRSYPSRRALGYGPLPERTSQARRSFSESSLRSTLSTPVTSSSPGFSEGSGRCSACWESTDSTTPRS